MFLRGGNHVHRRLSRSLSECVQTLRLSVSQNSQTLKCVLLNDDTERDRERPRERLSEREKGVICAKNKLRRAKRMARLNVFDDRRRLSLLAREKKIERNTREKTHKEREREANEKRKKSSLSSLSLFLLFCFSLSLSCFFFGSAFFGSACSLSKSFSLSRRRVSFPSLPQFC